MLDPLQRSVTKDFFGPIQFQNQNAVVARFQDSFSVLGWGRMPDVFPLRGLSQAMIHHHLAVLLASPEAWKEFLRAPDSLTFRKAASMIPQHAENALPGAKSESVGSMLNEMIEHFPLPQTYLGMVPSQDHSQPNFSINAFEALTKPTHGYGMFRFIPEDKPVISSVLGRTVRDYGQWKTGMLPFEIQCHFELREDALAQMKLDTLVIPKTATLSALKPGGTFDFPLIEASLAHDPFNKRLTFEELVWITRLPSAQIQRSLLAAAWIAAFLRWILTKSKLTLTQANLRFALDQNGQLVLASTQTLDDLRVEFEGQLIHTDITLQHYQKTNWYEAVIYAQKTARAQGLPDWKRLCVEPAPWLEPKFKKALEPLAPMMASLITGIKIGEVAPPTDAAEIKKCFSELRPV